MKLIRNCLICNTEFNTWTCRIKIGAGKYCSFKCKRMAQKDKIAWNKGLEGRQWWHNTSGLGNKGKNLSEEHRKKIGLANKGKKHGKHSEHWYQVMKGKIPWNKGIKFLQISGEKNYKIIIGRVALLLLIFK